MSTYRTRETLTLASLFNMAEARIQWSSDCEEWRVRLILNGAPVLTADYFTDDHNDAHATAHSMLRACVRAQ